MTSSSSATTTSKSVTFAPSATMRLALHVNNYTDDEYDACWFSPEDYKKFKQDIIRTARIIDNNTNDNTAAALLSSKRTLFCTRGVESKTKEGMKIRYKNVQTAKLAVLGEQVRRQLQVQAEKNDGDNKEQTIATLYAKYSASSVSAAYTKGLSDEMEVAKGQEEKTLEADRQTTRPQDITLRFMKLGRRSSTHQEQTALQVQRKVRNSAA